MNMISDTMLARIKYVHSDKQALKTVSFAFLSSRVACFLFVYLGHSLRTWFNFPSTSGLFEGVANWWLNPWTTFDSKWFLSVAHQGYQPHTTPFFPLYPFLLKLGGDSEAGMALAGICISNICFFLALYLLFRLTELELGLNVAKASVWLLAFYPTTAFFSAVYTESLFLLLLLLTFYSARLRRWHTAGLCGLLAALTRNPGVLICLALSLAYLKSIDYDWRSIRFSALGSITLPLCGLVLVQLYYWHLFDNPLIGIESQKYFFRSIGWPWRPVLADFENLVSLRYFGNMFFVSFLNLVTIGMTVILAIRYFKLVDLHYLVLIFGIISMNLVYQHVIPPYTAGSVRYMSTVFPFIQLLAIFCSTGWLARVKKAAGGVYFYVFLICSASFGMKSFLG